MRSFHQKKAWHQTVKRLYKEYPHIDLTTLCVLFGKSRQAYYKIENYRKKNKWEEGAILELVHQYRDVMPKVGTLKLQYLLAQHHLHIGRDSLNNLLSDQGLLIKRKKRKQRTTDSYHRFRKYKNLTKYFFISKTDTLWVSDITYISLINGFAYLSLVTDAYSGKIVGYCLHPTLESIGPIKALKQAIKQRRNLQKELIHHSDRGIQYCCNEYISILESHYIKISMSGKGNPYENAKAERINGILKEELKLGNTFDCFEQANMQVKESIDIYNDIRPHLSCDLLTPNQAHLFAGELKKRWKKKKDSESFEPVY